MLVLIGSLMVLTGCSDTRRHVLAYYDDHAGAIWELSYAPPRKICLDVVDASAGTTVTRIEDRKPFDLDYNISFAMCRQDSGIVLLGLGETPIFDVYHAVTHKRVSGLEALEQAGPGLKKNIARIDLKGTGYRHFADVVIEITTRAWEKRYYNVQKRQFFGSQEELLEFARRSASEVLPQRLTAFAMAEDRLYAVTSSDTADAEYLSRIAGSTSFDPERFNMYRERDCSRCRLHLLSGERFKNGWFLYHDGALAVVTSMRSYGLVDEERITAVDTSGKKLFEITQDDYPNRVVMRKDGRHPGRNVTVAHDNMHGRIMLSFGKYGALCIDLASGKKTCTYQPKVKPEHIGTVRVR